MNSTDKLILTDELFLGKGNHKEVYIHPADKNLCVKILFAEPDEDFDREMRYHHGTVDTNRGRGYVFENVTGQKLIGGAS